MLKTSPWPKLALAAALVLAGCKILPTPPKGEGGGGPAKFDPDRQAEEIWTSRVLPYLEKRAGSFAEVTALAKSDPAGAGAKYGNPKKQASSPWTYAARVEGRIVASNTASRNGTIDVDVDGDAKADVRVQIGPTIPGTALRDTLDFVNFNDFTNQIDFAQFGKALNKLADRTALSKLPREDLEGRTAKALGALVLKGASELPVLTPAAAEIGPKS
jgi:predicted lipoprotein